MKHTSLAINPKAVTSPERAFAINFTRPHPVKAYVAKVLPIATTAYLAANAVAFVFLLITSFYCLWIGRIERAPLATPVHSAGEIAELQQQTSQQLAELRTVIIAQQARFPGAGKLAALANTLPARTWITSIESNWKDATATIRASYLTDPEKPYALPAKAWIDALKADPKFGDQLKQLSLRQSSQKTLGKGELFNFELSAAWER